MKRRKLGNTGFEVAPLAFGGNVFGWTVDEPTSFRLLDTFVDAGFNLIDTADSYSRWVPATRAASPGDHRRWIAQWTSRRSSSRPRSVDMGLGYKCLRREYITQGVEQSLKGCRSTRSTFTNPLGRRETLLEETLEAYSGC
jgi:aryl-alcohol dehydrogenase-like predicted oxidoreductase